MLFMEYDSVWKLILRIVNTAVKNEVGKLIALNIVNMSSTFFRGWQIVKLMVFLMPTYVFLAISMFLCLLDLKSICIDSG